MSLDVYDDNVNGAAILRLQDTEANQERIDIFKGLGDGARGESGSVRVAINNGTGASGQATEVAAGLGALGFDTSPGTGDAENFGFTRTLVRYQPGNEAAARYIAAQLVSGADLQEVGATYVADVIVVTGTDYAGVEDSLQPPPTPLGGAGGTTVPGTDAAAVRGGDGDVDDLRLRRGAQHPRRPELRVAPWPRSPSSAPATSGSPPAPASPTSGHDVVCADIDAEQGRAPVTGARSRSSRTGSTTWSARASQPGACSFVLGAADAVADGEFVYLCVPTPQGADGSRRPELHRGRGRARSARTCRPRPSSSTSRPCRSARPASSSGRWAAPTSTSCRTPSSSARARRSTTSSTPTASSSAPTTRAPPSGSPSLYLGVPGAAHGHRPGLGRDHQVRHQRLPRHEALVRQRRRRRLRGGRRRRQRRRARHGLRQAHRPRVPPARPGLGRLVLPEGHPALVRIAEDAGYDFDLLDGVHRRQRGAVRPGGRQGRRRWPAARSTGATHRACGASRSRPAPTTSASRRRSHDRPPPARPRAPSVAGLRPDGHRRRCAELPERRGRRRPLRRLRGRRRARRAHRVGRVPVARPRQGGRGHGRTAASSTPATCSTGPRSCAGASTTRASAAADGPGRRHRRRRLPRLAPLRRASSTGATRSSPSTTSSPAGSDNIEHLFGHDGFTFVEHDVSRVPVGARRRSTPCCTSPARRRRVDYLELPDPDPEGRQPRHPQRARPGQGQGRPVPPGLDQRGLRRPPGAPAARDLLGQREPDRAPGRATTRPSASPRRSRWPTTAPTASTCASSASSTPTARACGPTTAGWCRTSSCRRCRASRSPSTATAPRPAASATSTTRSAASSPCSTATLDGPGQHRQPGRVHHARAGRARARGHRLELGDRLRGRCRSTTPAKRRPDLTLARTELGWEPEIAAPRGPRTHRADVSSR